MKIRYTGGRTWIEVVLNRVPYIFSKENNLTLDIKNQAVVNHIFSLPNRAEFEAVVEEIGPIKKEIKEQREDNLKCSICGFIAKSGQGLLVHIAKHKKPGGK